MLYITLRSLTRFKVGSQSREDAKRTLALSSLSADPCIRPARRSDPEPHYLKPAPWKRTTSKAKSMARITTQKRGSPLQVAKVIVYVILIFRLLRVIRITRISKSKSNGNSKNNKPYYTLHYTILYYIRLYYVIIYSTVLYYIALYHTTPYYMILFHHSMASIVIELDPLRLLALAASGAKRAQPPGGSAGWY